MALNQASRNFVARYARDFPDLIASADAARRLIVERIRDSHIAVHSITTRVKHPTSLRRKLLLKEYKRPSAELTDQLGLRVIAYFQDDVDRLVALLKAFLVIDERKSVDKRGVLGPREFGYRSVHLVGRLQGIPFGTQRRPRLDSRWYEVQVRSLLEEGWAEIEHDVVYKAGIKYDREVLREWGALAGALEIADSHFLTLRAKRREMIAKYRQDFDAGRELSSDWDVARLLAFLEVERPNAIGWIQAEDMGKPFPPGSESDAIGALNDAGLRDPNALRLVMASEPFIAALGRYAQGNLVSPSEVSHLACVAMAVGTVARAALNEHLGDLATDRSLVSALEVT